MAKRVTTLFIEDTAIRLLVAKGKQAEKWASVPLEPELVKHGLIQDKDKVAEKLKDLFRWARITNKKVVIGLSEPGSLYRIIKLPKLPEAILPEAVKREAERVIPLPQDEVYLAHQVIAVQGEEMQLFLAAFSRNAVDNVVKTLQLAGMKPYLMDLVPLALCRITDKSAAIIVSLRSSNFEIAIMVDNIPQVIRSLSLPGEATSLLDKLPTIAEELDRTVTFYNSSHSDKPLDATVPVFVDGDLVHVPESWSTLVGQLGSVVTPLPSPMHSAPEFDASQFTVNIGLVAKENPDGASSLINFNALPKSYLPEAPRLSRITLPIAAAIAILILFYIGAQTRIAGDDAARLRSDLALLQARIAQQSKEIPTIKDLITKLESQVKPSEEKNKTVETNIATFDKTVTGLKERQRIVDEDTSKIISLLPDTAQLMTLSIAEKITVLGTAPDEDVVFAYARALIKTNIFKSVVIRAITLDKQGDKQGQGYTFEIAITP